MLYDIVEKNSKFLVTKDKKPVLLPSNTNPHLITEFDSKEDAQKYINILLSLKKEKVK